MVSKWILPSVSLAVGLALFSILIRVVGIDALIEPFLAFSLWYLLAFLAVSWVLYAVATLRWAIIARYQGIHASFWLLFRYKMMGAAVSYLTPVAMIGGEPVRAQLFKQRLAIDTDRAYSSVFLETAYGFMLDGIFFASALLILVAFIDAPTLLKWISLTIALLGLLTVVLFQLSLVKRWGPFSVGVRLFSKLLRFNFLKVITEKLQSIENEMAEFFKMKKKAVLLAVLVTATTWPLTFIQYKFALLAVGYDAGFTLILLSIIGTAVASMIPVPAALGVQEGSHFGIFQLIVAPQIGIALSLLIRLRDVLQVGFGLFVLSHEGLSIFDVWKRKKI